MVLIPCKAALRAGVTRSSSRKIYVKRLVIAMILVFCIGCLYQGFIAAQHKAPSVSRDGLEVASFLPYKESLGELITAQALPENMQYIAHLFNNQDKILDYYLSENRLGSVVSFSVDNTVEDVARGLLLELKQSGHFELHQDDYLDIYGKVWACLLSHSHDGVTDVFLVCIEQKHTGRSEVRVLRYDTADFTL